MDIKEYKLRASEAGYIEQAPLNSGLEVSLKKFIDFNATDHELKIYLNKLILCRSFYGTYISWYADVVWFIDNFFKAYGTDVIKPELSGAIREAVKMIMSEEIFTKKIIGTTFMFGVIEFYAKYKLGFRPLQYDFFDEKKKEYVKKYSQKSNDLFISTALKHLQLQDFPISQSLNEIDNETSLKLSAKGIEEGRWVQYKVRERIGLARNTILHGERHSFSNIGPYLVMLYILFHLHEIA